ncbi:hypothetical protein ALNOE001_11850 [Candidatus Methanobinarius endosymbioticus]|uniref:Uncharacterized protein n=1 Tax=Candidatus Methanobinarius endosymbioticus TaxID=2006182 RepID=A0A366MC38_9EURY|nr:hypothetical protein ALNOE001_11850 [Candidatus Methanobinarius endosymbioticus]
MTVLGNKITGNSANLGQMIYNIGNIGTLNLTYLNNETITTKKGQNIIVYATLTDDMGNTVTRQIISFYLTSTHLADVVSTEGYANFTYNVTNNLIH